MKNFKVNKIALAAGTVMALGAAVSSQAQADSLLFPYFQVGNGVYSFLMLHSDAAGTFAAPHAVHYIWNYKADPTVATSGCVHEDRLGLMTQYDIIQQTFEGPTVTGGSMTDLPKIFGDKSTANYLKTVPATGFLIVSDPSTEAANRGQAIVVDTASGTIAAYKGLNNPLGLYEGNFYTDGDAGVPTAGLYSFTSKTSYDMTWYPTTETGSTLGATGVDTSWNVIVTGAPNVAGFTSAGVADAAAGANPFGMAIVSGYGAIGWAGAVQMNSGFAGTYDRDEVFTSGNKPLNIVCEATIKRADFMNNGNMVDSVNGGYNWAVFTPQRNMLSTSTAVPINATGVMMTKIETTTALGARKTMVSAENSYPNLPY